MWRQKVYFSIFLGTPFDNKSRAPAYLLTRLSPTFSHSSSSHPLSPIHSLPIHSLPSTLHILSPRPIYFILSTVSDPLSAPLTYIPSLPPSRIYAFRPSFISRPLSPIPILQSSRLFHTPPLPNPLTFPPPPFFCLQSTLCEHPLFHLPCPPSSFHVHSLSHLSQRTLLIPTSTTPSTLPSRIHTRPSLHPHPLSPHSHPFSPIHFLQPTPSYALSRIHSPPSIHSRAFILPVLSSSTLSHPLSPIQCISLSSLSHPVYTPPLSPMQASPPLSFTPLHTTHPFTRRSHSLSPIIYLLSPLSPPPLTLSSFRCNFPCFSLTSTPVPHLLRSFPYPLRSLSA